LSMVSFCSFHELTSNKSPKKREKNKIPIFAGIVHIGVNSRDGYIKVLAWMAQCTVLIKPFPSLLSGLEVKLLVVNGPSGQTGGPAG
jgi:hypothetical protein